MAAGLLTAALRRVLLAPLFTPTFARSSRPQTDPNRHPTANRHRPQNEHKEVKVDDILGAEAAKQIVKDALNMYQEHYVPKKLRTNW
jgi:hypothetical protein